jgi:RimJ/RimL family protein N-acetyltransferase
MDDLEEIHHILNEGFGESPLEERREWLEWTVRNYVALTRLYQPPYGDRGIILKATNALVGSVGLVPSVSQFRRLASFRREGETEDAYMQPEFGLFWVVAPEYRRQGYAAEAAQAMIDHAFQYIKLRRIVATTEYDNLASQAVMRRLGMIIEQNPTPGDPPWFQVVGSLDNPARKRSS